ncbi:MAG TPA: hypothetical protein VFL59_05115 [Candidatus Nanopelagicales bacterium]|nr:hypothetical protein [Candidatus Nanopelagicales bacterium]
MRSTDLRIGHVYAVPVAPGPWCRHAVPARVMTRGTGGRTLVLLPDGLPGSPSREAQPCGSLVWVEADVLVCAWGEWPERAAAVRGDMLAAVSSVVAAIGGRGAPVLVGAGGPPVQGQSPVSRARAALNRWARPDPRHPATRRP